MPTFSWKGKNKMGKTQEGVITADSKDIVESSRYLNTK